MARLLSVLTLLCLANCGRAPRAPAPPAATTAPVASRSLADQLSWLPRTTRSIGRFRPGEIPALQWFAAQLEGRPPACWSRIEQTVTAGYMFELRPGESIFGFETRSERADVERCIESAWPAGHALHATLRRDGELTAIETSFGRALLWWRGGGWVVAGTADEIEAVRASRGSLQYSPCMQRALKRLPDRPIAWISCTRMPEELLGVPAAGWVVGMSLELGFLRAEVSILYRSAADATRARQALTPAALPGALSPELRERLGKLPATVQGDRLVIRVQQRFSERLKSDLAALERLASDGEEEQPGDPKETEDPLKKYYEEQMKKVDPPAKEKR